MRRTIVSLVLVGAVLNGCDDGATPPKGAERTREEIIAGVCHSIGAFSAKGVERVSPAETVVRFRAHAEELASIGESRLSEVLTRAAARLTRSETRIDGAAYLVDDIDRSALIEVERFLTSQPSVRSVEYRTSREAFQEFRRMYRDNPEFYEGMPRDALPPSFRFEVDSRTAADELEDSVERLPGVDEVRFGGEFSAAASLGPELLSLCLGPES